MLLYRNSCKAASQVADIPPVLCFCSRLRVEQPAWTAWGTGLRAFEKERPLDLLIPVLGSRTCHWSCAAGLNLEC